MVSPGAGSPLFIYSEKVRSPNFEVLTIESTLFPTFDAKLCNGVELFNAEPETEDGDV